MRDEVPAWPPGASCSIKIVARPSEPPYTAAARPRRAAANDHDVVFVEARGDRKAERFGKNLKLRLYEGAPIRETHERARRRVDAELRNELGVDGVVEVEPFERHLVPREKIANRVRSGIEIAADHNAPDAPRTCHTHRGKSTRDE